MKTSILLKVLLVFCFTSIISLAQTETKGPYTGIYTTSVLKLSTLDGSVNFYRPGTPPHYGYTPATKDSMSKSYRSIFEFDLPANLPAGARITGVYFTYKTLAITSGSFIVTYIPISGFTPNKTLEDIWGITESGEYLGEVGASTIGHTTYFADLAEKVNQALQESRTKIYLGIKAGSERYRVSNNEFESLQITYKYAIMTSVTVKNNYGDSIYVQINNGGYHLVPSGNHYWLQMNVQLDLKARESFHLGIYDYIWNQDPNTSEESRSCWEKKTSVGVVDNLSDPIYHYTTNPNEFEVEFTAHSRRICPVSFSTETSLSTLQIPLTINGVTYINTAPDINILENNPINLSVPPKLDGTDNIIYYFHSWRRNNGHLTTSSTFTAKPTQLENYKAVYVGYADKPIAPHVTSTSGDHTKVTFSWDEYPNSNVTQYQISRRAEQIKGGEDITSIIATVPRGVTSYTDLYYRVNGDGDYNLYYNVLPYYSTDATYAHIIPNDNRFAFIGSRTGYADGGEILKTAASSKETNYSLSSYPNPFNPTTRISYSLKKNGLVTIRVYDILGNKISELVNEYKEAGSYELSFDGSNLPSGYYLCRIKSGDYTDTRKLLLVK
ncbi:MAG: T9SS type A sorting domain-containing protein [Bacillota bacterium]